MPESWGIQDNSGQIPRNRMVDPRGQVYAGGCWAEKRIHTGSSASRYSGTFSPCEKSNRPGKLTCYWHDKFEAEAQAYKAKLDAEAEQEKGS